MFLSRLGMGRRKVACPLAPSTAAAAAFCRCSINRLRSAAAFASVFPQQTVDDGGGTTDAGLHSQGACGAVSAARAAFHAGVAVMRPFFGELKTWWGYIAGHAAAVHFFVFISSVATFFR